MKNNDSISIAVIKRLPRYYRYLTDLAAHGIDKVSSTELSRRMGLTASQIRQDLNCFGDVGRKGYGYNVESLRAEIGAIFGIGNNYSAIMIGAGNLGHALANHFDFKKRGVHLAGIFDIRREIVGESISGLTIKHMDQVEAFCKENKPDIAILTVPKTEIRPTVARLTACGVNAFWNFAGLDLHLEFPNAQVENVHMGDSLMSLCYKIANKKDI